MFYFIHFLRQCDYLTTREQSHPRSLGQNTSNHSQMAVLESLPRTKLLIYFLFKHFVDLHKYKSVFFCKDKTLFYETVRN